MTSYKHIIKSAFAVFSVILALAFIKSCATPVAPTGGEPDRTGPQVISSEPANGTTNFRGTEVRIHFDKFIDRNSFRRNVSVEPDLGIEFEVDFRRRSGIIEFKSPLPENTTIIIQAGTEVTDTNRNKMERPYEIALSTGDVLDNSTIIARILDAETGRGESGMRVFLYREPFDLTTRANYVAQTDTSGSLAFGYIAEGSYKAFWINDVNRNRIWDIERERAQPFRFETFDVAYGDSLDLGTLFVSLPDTVSPRIDGVGLLSENRLRLRLSEEVIWKPDAFITVTDTLDNEYTRAFPLYESEQDEAVIFAQSELPLPAEGTFTLKPSGITDRSGNSLRIDFSPFPGSAVPDTSILRTISHNAGSGLFPDEALEITYSRFIDDDAVRDSLQIIEGDRLADDWPHSEVDRHILRIKPDGQWQAGIRYQFRIWNPWEEEREQIEPDIWQRNQLGSIEITLQNNDPEIINYLILTDKDSSIRIDTTFTESVTVDNLPPLEFKAIVFEDVNGNGRWDPGVVDPFERPEPYALRQTIPVREGFTTEIELIFPLKDDLPVHLNSEPPDDISEDIPLESTIQNGENEPSNQY
jgi:hypothetical protein